jgi:predicted alpha/beta-fold hydrolase
MPFYQASYKPHLLLRNGHVQTIYPALFRKPAPVPWQRQRLELADGDFLDLDWWKNNSSKLVILGHGLEGSSNSSYILAAAHLFHQKGYDVLAWNHRSCSGEMNRLPRFYHHAVAEDLDSVVQVSRAYGEVHLLGYSLGGNVLLKYLGSPLYSKPGNLSSCIAISVPVYLPGCVTEIHRRKNALYHNRFLKTLKQKVRIKAGLTPGSLDLTQLDKVKTLTDFDRYFTAPLHGFASPEDYYQKASTLKDLENIKHPVLLLQAQDDPMLGAGCFPEDIARESDFLNFVKTRYGGHVSFMQPGAPNHWMEDLAFKFIDSAHNELQISWIK